MRPLHNDRWAFWGLLALLCWLPLPLGSNRTFAVALLVFWSQILLWGTVFAWRHDLAGLSARLTLFRWPVGLLGAFILVPWLQWLPLPADWLAVLSPEALAVSQGVVDTLRVSLDPGQTQLYAALSFAYWSVFVAALVLVRDSRRLDTLALVLVGSGVFQALLGAALFSTGATYRLFFSELTHDRVKGAFVYHNHMAGYMEICLSVGIGLMLARLGGGGKQRPSTGWKEKLQAAIDFSLSPKMRLRLMLVIMVIALVLTRSRMGNTGFFAALLIVGLLTIVLSRRTAPRTVALIASLVIIDVVVVGSWIGVEKVVDRVQETALTSEEGGREESVELRVDAARHAYALVEDFPWLGTGAGSFYTAYLRYRTPREGYFDHAHNDYAEIAADFGGPATLLLGGFVLSAVVSAVLVLARRRSDLPRGLAFGGLMAIVAFLIHSTVDFNLQIPANALTLLVVFAMLWSVASLPRGNVKNNSPVD